MDGKTSMGDLIPQAAELWQLAGVTKPIILASSSPRRAAILRAVGCPFKVVPPSVQESEYGSWDGGELLRRRAVQKAESVKAEFSTYSVLAADTIVKLDDRVFGKPQDHQEAASILRSLSGRVHEVWTAMCFIPASSRIGNTAVSRTAVTLRSLSSSEIDTYVMTGEPLDKAGAYGIQGIGGLWIQSIEGCYFNVVGLPLSQLWDLIKSV